MASRKTYQFTLLKAIDLDQIPVTNHFFNSSIKQRIIMLQQQKSKKRNILKMTIIAPLLVAFVFIFNTEIVAQPSQKESNITISNKGKINQDKHQPKLIKIHKKTTKAELDKTKKQLKKEGIDFDVKELKFNKNNEITNISISVKNKKGSSMKHRSKSNVGIEPFYISAKNGDINALSGQTTKTNKHIFISKDKPTPHKSKVNIEIEEDGMLIINGKSIDFDQLDFDIDVDSLIKGQSFAFSINMDDKKEQIEFSGDINLDEIQEKLEGILKNKKGDTKVFVYKGDLGIDQSGDQILIDGIKLDQADVEFEELKQVDTKVFIIKGDKKIENLHIDSIKDLIHEELDFQESKQFIFLDDPEKEKLIIIDGKEASFKELDSLAKEGNLDSFDVLKPKTAMSIYGEKAKDGAIIVTTKQ